MGHSRTITSVSRLAAVAALVGVPMLGVSYAPMVAPLLAFTILSGVGAVGLSLAWKSLDLYSKALAESELLERPERERLRSVLLKDRLFVLAGLGVLGCAFGTGAVAGKLLLPTPPTAPIAYSTLLYFLGAGLAVALRTVAALVSLFLSLDSFICEIRDLARRQRTRDELAGGSRDLPAERAALLDDAALRVRRLTH